MTLIFGMVRRDGLPVPPDAAEAIRRVAATLARDGTCVWARGSAMLGQARTFTTQEDCFETLPIFASPQELAFTACGRLDNHDELTAISRSDRSLRGQPGISDCQLMLYAYIRWGQAACTRLRGDWAFAAWHPGERRLFIARDQFGKGALYYYVDSRIFAFSSSRRALLSLGATREPDELYLAETMTSMDSHHGERTPDASIKRLPPAHCLTITPARLDTRLYWRMEDVEELRLANRAEYVEAFRDVFDRAVRVRLRAERPIAAMLSGGLDSGSVAATAAETLAAEGKRLCALTLVPEADISAYSAHLANEFPLARATADLAGNIDLIASSALLRSPIANIRRALWMHTDPAAIGDGSIFEVLRDLGYRVILGGRMGNYTASWEGLVSSQRLAYQLRTLGPKQWLRGALGRRTPSGLRVVRMRRRIETEWYRSSSPILPAFAERVGLTERWLDNASEPPARSALERRLRMLAPGRQANGDVLAQIDSALAIDIRDPTVDLDLVCFTLGVPDRIFIDPRSGLDRWLIREAMRGRLPDAVRLGRVRGWRFPVLVPRLRAAATEVEAVLGELADGEAAGYVDVAHMREAWRTVQSSESPEAVRRALLLLRGMVAGLFVNQWRDYR